MAVDNPSHATTFASGSRSLPADEVNPWRSPPDDQAPEPPEPGHATTAAPQNTGARVAREIVETLLLALVIFLAVRMIVLNFRVDGMSMDPNLDDGEMLLVNRNAYFHFDLNDLRNILPGEDREGEDIVYPFDPPERGDIVVFDPPVASPDKPYIKRVIGLPGETVSFQGGKVFVDGEELNEAYIDDQTKTRCNDGANCEVTVPADEVYVLGDNRNNSSDSRSFGPVDVDQIIGKAWFGYWPADDVGLVPHYDYPGFPDQ